MLARLLAARDEAAYTALRVVSGLAFSFHGAQKLFGLFASKQPELGTQLWFGGVIELVCGLAIALGLFSVWAAFLASGTMAVAYVQFHWKFQLDAAFLPGVNQGEMAVLYCFVFLYIACRGGVKWCVKP